MAIDMGRTGLTGYINRMNEERARSGKDDWGNTIRPIPADHCIWTDTAEFASGGFIDPEVFKKVMVGEPFSDVRKPDTTTGSTSCSTSWHGSVTKAISAEIDAERAKEIAKREKMLLMERDDSVKKRKAHFDAMLATIRKIHAWRPALCNRRVEIEGPGSVRHREQAVKCMENIVHASNMDRAKFNVHYRYQEHVTALVEKWDSGFEAQLVQWVEAEERRVEDHHAAAAMTPEALEAKRLAEEQLELMRITKLSDPADALPDYLLEDLTVGAERVRGRAVHGEW